MDDGHAVTPQVRREPHGQGRIDPSALGNRGRSHPEFTELRSAWTLDTRRDRYGVDFMSGEPLEAGEVDRDSFLPTEAKGRKDVCNNHVGYRPTPRSMTQGVFRMMNSSVAMKVRK
jgi:hypothetical protein